MIRLQVFESISEITHAYVFACSPLLVAWHELPASNSLQSISFVHVMTVLKCPMVCLEYH